MRPMCIAGQRKLLLSALESSTSSWWSYGVAAHQIWNYSTK